MTYTKNYQEIEIGDTVELTRKVGSLAGYFPKGDIVEVCDIDPIRGYGFIDSEGNRVIECGWDCCKKITK